MPEQHAVHISLKLGNGIKCNFLLLFVLFCFCFVFYRTGNVEVAQLLRKHGGNWDLLDKTGSTALHWAVDGANLDMIRWMLQDGCKVDVKDETSGD